MKRAPTIWDAQKQDMPCYSVIDRIFPWSCQGPASGISSVRNALSPRVSPKLDRVELTTALFCQFPARISIRALPLALPSPFPTFSGMSAPGANERPPLPPLASRIVHFRQLLREALTNASCLDTVGKIQDRASISDGAAREGAFSFFHVSTPQYGGP